MAVMSVGEPISPELVLVDPFLAEVERPREYAERVIARQVVPLGVPLVPQDSMPGRRVPAWLMVAIGLCLFTGGLLASFQAFSRPSTGPSRPATTVVTTASRGAPVGPTGFVPPTPPP